MLKALVLVCSIAITPDLRNCDQSNAVDVMMVPEEFGTPAMCFMHGQAYVAQTEFGRQLAADERVKEWQKAMRAGQLGPVQPCAEYDDERWIERLKNAKKLNTADRGDIANAYNFFAAAAYHQNYVLKRLLPEAGLFVV